MQKNKHEHMEKSVFASCGSEFNEIGLQTHAALQPFLPHNRW